MTSSNPASRRRSSTLALLAAVAVTAIVTARADAQYRIDNSQARDANNRVGSGGFNGSVGGGAIQQRIGGSAGNYIVTGNITGGRAFRGALGYTDPTAFRGSLGSASFDNFYRDSVGFGDARGGNGVASNFATINPQPFFGAGKTVQAPSGFVRDPNLGGGFVVAPRTLVTPNDARLDYGGATRADISQGVASSSRVIGGAGLLGNNDSGIGIAPFDVAAQPATAYQLSEYTSLARTRAGLLDVPQGADALNSAAGLNRLRNYQAAAVLPGAADNATPAVLDPNAPNSGPINNRLDATTGGPPVNGTPGANGINPANGMNPANGGASADDRSPLNGNTQYAELRRRMEASDSVRRLPGSEAVDRANQHNAVLLKKANPANSTKTDDKDPNAMPSAKAGGSGTPNDTADATGRTPGSTPIESKRVGGTPLGADNLDKPDRSNVEGGTRHGTGAANAANGNGSTTQPAVAPDTLNLPRPQAPANNAGPANAPGNAPANAPANGAASDEPMRIKSLATGVRDPKLADALKRGEALMKDGKFATAIDTYERAGNAASNDSIVFIGRGIAELGGSYYRRSEAHLRQAFGADRALLYAKFDLRELLGDQRLNFLVGDLSDVARTNPKDPGPLLLLAFIYYNGGMEDRAARALAMAQTRAGGNDSTVTLLQQSWKLPAEPASGAGEESTK